MLKIKKVVELPVTGGMGMVKLCMNDISSVPIALDVDLSNIFGLHKPTRNPLTLILLICKQNLCQCFIWGLLKHKGRWMLGLFQL